MVKLVGIVSDFFSLSSYVANYSFFIAMSLLLVFFPNVYYGHSFLVLASILCLYTIYKIVYKQPIRLNLLTGVLVFQLCLSFSSFLVASKYTLVIHDIATKLLFVVVVVYVSGLTREFMAVLYRCLYIVFLFNLGCCILNLFQVFGFSTGFIGTNHNEQACTLLMLLPSVLLFDCNKIHRILSVLFLALTLLCLYFLGAKGVLVSFLVTTSSFFIIRKFKFPKSDRRRLKMFLILGSVVSMLIFWFILFYGGDIFNNGSLYRRIELWKRGLSLSMEKPMFGFGSGHAELVLYKTYFSKEFLGQIINGIQKPYSLHNLYITSLIENGFVGLLALLYLVYTVCIKYLCSDEDSRLMTLSFLSLSVYFVASLFYENVSPNELFFSKPYLCFAIYLGVFSSHFKSGLNIKSLYVFPVTIILFIWYFNQNVQYREMRQTFGNGFDNPNLLLEMLDSSNSLLSKSYLGMVIPFYKARAHEITGDMKSASNEYECALDLDPWNERIIYNYARASILNSSNLNQLPDLISRIKEIQPVYYYHNNQTRLLIIEGEYMLELIDDDKLVMLLSIYKKDKDLNLTILNLIDRFMLESGLELDVQSDYSISDLNRMHASLEDLIYLKEFYTYKRLNKEYLRLLRLFVEKVKLLNLDSTTDKSRLDYKLIKLL